MPADSTRGAGGANRCSPTVASTRCVTTRSGDGWPPSARNEPPKRWPNRWSRSTSGLTESRSGRWCCCRGFGSRPEEILDPFRPALDQGYRLVTLRGSVPVAAGRFGWPTDDADEVVISQLHAVGDPERPILFGFSQGARIASQLAWSGRVDASGVFLMAPAFGPESIPTPDAVTRRVPTAILAGDEDRRIDEIRHAVERLEALGVPVRYDERPGLGHLWPDDFAEILNTTLKWMRSDR